MLDYFFSNMKSAVAALINNVFELLSSGYHASEGLMFEPSVSDKSGERAKTKEKGVQLSTTSAIYFCASRSDGLLTRVSYASGWWPILDYCVKSG